MSTWILLRGPAREARHWGDFPRELAERVPPARIRGIDLPGNGILYAVPSPLHVAEMLASVRARAGTPPFTVLGLGLGGMVAAEWAHRHPAEVEACILVNGGMRPHGALHERIQPRSYAALLRCALQWQRHADAERIVWRITSNRPVDPALLADWIAWRREAPVAASNALRQF
ncbi:alpha/beta hydrolase, partial [Oxalobacteraceae bacterium OM1]